jgi:2-polyprenyl-3-methyl-5-hydroxy-6-metoxy-1,4-benzoquinol methylase
VSLNVRSRFHLGTTRARPRWRDDPLDRPANDRFSAETQVNVADLKQTRESQYQVVVDIKDKHGLTPLGLMINQAWRDDPKRLAFTFARYKFVAKMLAGKKNVLEIGCADAFCTRIVQQSVAQVTVIDFDPVFIADVKARSDPKWPLAGAFVHDVLSGPVPGKYDGIYALDVLEHIEGSREHEFLRNMVAALTEYGVVVIGMPSLESQDHASPQSKAGHVNCKSGDDLKRTLERHFHNVFMFSMNDEVIHTGFFPMAQYLLAVACQHKVS